MEQRREKDRGKQYRVTPSEARLILAQKSGNPLEVQAKQMKSGELLTTGLWYPWIQLTTMRLLSWMHRLSSGRAKKIRLAVD